MGDGSVTGGDRSSLAALSQSLLDSSRMGLITLDANRRIERCLGSLVGHLPTGCPATEAMPFLIGLDDVLDQIAGGQRSALRMPRLALQEGDMGQKALSLEIMRVDGAGGIQILVRDETELAELEQKVLQQRNELALANEALSEAKRQLEAALREKASFLANISHDLKTPLQVIIGNAEILRGDLPDEEREAFLQDVLDNSNFLLALITDLLDASALETNQLTLTEDVVDLDAVLERVVSMARQIPKGKTRHFDVNIDAAGRRLRADPMRLQRLLLNVVSNAVKFTEDGGRINVRAALDAAGDLIIAIEDDGCGIDPAMMSRIFEPFMRAGLAEGSGLGLHIARGLAELHDADLHLASELGVGTRATLRLPKSRVLDAPS